MVCRGANAHYTWLPAGAVANDARAVSTTVPVGDQASHARQGPFVQSGTRPLPPLPETSAALAAPGSPTGVGILSLGSRTGETTCNVPPRAPTPGEGDESGREKRTTQDTAPRIPEVCEFGVAPVPTEFISPAIAATPMPWRMNR